MSNKHNGRPSEVFQMWLWWFKVIERSKDACICFSDNFAVPRMSEKSYILTVNSQAKNTDRGLCQKKTKEKEASFLATQPGHLKLMKSLECSQHPSLKYSLYLSCMWRHPIFFSSFLSFFTKAWSTYFWSQVYLSNAVHIKMCLHESTNSQPSRTKDVCQFSIAVKAKCPRRGFGRASDPHTSQAWPCNC